MVFSTMLSHAQNAELFIKGKIEKIFMIKETKVPVGYDGSSEKQLIDLVSVFLSLKGKKEIFQMDLEQAKRFGIVELSKDKVITKSLEGKEVEIKYIVPPDQPKKSFGISIEGYKVIDLRMAISRKESIPQNDSPAKDLIEQAKKILISLKSRFNFSKSGTVKDKMQKLRDLEKEALEATEVLKQAIRIEPGNAEAHQLLGISLFMMGNTNDAIVAYNKALQLKPDYFDAQYNLGLAYKNLGRDKEAQEAFQLANRMKYKAQIQENRRLSSKKQENSASSEDDRKIYEGKVIKAVMNVAIINGGSFQQDNSTMTIVLKEFPDLQFVIKVSVIKELLRQRKIPEGQLEGKNVKLLCNKPKKLTKNYEVVDMKVN